MSRIRTPNLDRHTKKLEQLAQELPSEAHEHFRSITPIDTGNARSKTKRSGDSIRGDYDYVNKLNNGYSRQARDGMTDPTVEFMRDKIRGLA